MPLYVDSIQTDGSAPAAPAVGQIWYDAAQDKAFVMKATGIEELVTPGSSGAGGLVMTDCYDLPTDISTTSSSSYQDVLTRQVTTHGFPLIITCHLNGAINNANRGLYLQLLVDGVVIHGGGDCSGNATNQPVSISFTTKLVASAARHTFKLQWKLSGSATAYCRPFTYPERESATFFLQEVSV